LGHGNVILSVGASLISCVRFRRIDPPALRFYNDSHTRAILRSQRILRAFVFSRSEVGEKSLAYVVMAYGGSFQADLCVHWLKHKKDFRVIAVACNLGQNRRMDDVGKRALAAGADSCHVADLRDRFLRDFCFETMKANAEHFSGVFLSASLSRPAIAQEIMRIARERGTSCVAHASHFHGNDQVRYELTFSSLNPDVEILSPSSEWGFKSREEMVEYARRFNLSLPEESDSRWNVDDNIWGASTVIGAEADPGRAAPAEAYRLTRDPTVCADEPTRVEIGFDAGLPIRLNGAEMQPLDLVRSLNNIGALNGIGRFEYIGDSLFGGQSREVHEAPGAVILYEAHRALEWITLDSETRRYKRMLSEKFADLVFNGLWFSNLRAALSAFFHSTQNLVCGDVGLEIYKGKVTVRNCASPNRLEGSDGKLPDPESIKGFLEINRNINRKSRTRRKHQPGARSFGRNISGSQE